MKERVTIYDIAEKLNISTATVNRALNNKPKVSEDTRKLVIKTAQKMGYRPNRVAKSMARKTIKLGLIINVSIPVFYDEILRGAMAAYEELMDYNVVFDYYFANQPMHSRRQEILDKMQQMGESGYNGILILPTADVRGYHEVISELFRKNVFVATVVSDILGSNRIFSLRQNAILAGKVAAELLWWFTDTKKVAIFSGYKDVGIHAETIEGFYEGCKQKPLEIVGIYENQDDPELAYFNTQRMLDEHPDTEGIYINSANSSTVCSKLIEKGYGGKIKIVASDVFPELKQFMHKDIIHASIFQDPFNQGRLALKYLYKYIEDSEKPDSNILIKPQIVLKSNIDLFI